MEWLKKQWKQVPAPVRKPLVMLIGGVIIIAGAILLPLPGPGWAIIFVGFAVLASEFTFAERIRDWVVRQFKTLFAYLKRRR